MTLNIQYAHTITLVDALYIAPGRVACYILTEGDRAAIIETGTKHSVPGILKTLNALGLSAENVDYVIPTHVHLDHAAGAGELMRLCKNARLVIHPRGASHMIDPTKLIASTKAIYGDRRFDRLYGSITAVEASRVIEANDMMTLDLNGRKLQLLDTPGHALHHICIHDSKSNGIFTGDNLGVCYPNIKTRQGSFIIPATTPVHFDPIAMNEQIDRMMALEPDCFYLTHFGKVKATKDYSEPLKKNVNAFAEIAHRHKNSDNRVSTLESALTDYLLSELKAMQPRGALQDYKEFLINDIKLDAQGLDVWLTRQEKR